MGINSRTRRLVKRILYPVLGESRYRAVQSRVKARDIKRGIYHEKELHLLPRAVAPGETVLDIGANFGLYAYHLSRAVGETGRVFAFEPVPYTFSCLEKVLQLLKTDNVTAFPKGCSHSNATVTFTISVQESGAPRAGLSHMSGSRGRNKQSGEGNNSRRVECEVARLDTLLPDVNPSFMKIDVEGAELLVLEGAVGLIERSHPTVVCEINPGFLVESGIALNSLLGFFADRGYGIYRSTERGRLVGHAAAPITDGNYVFVHASRMSRFPELEPAAAASRSAV